MNTVNWLNHLLQSRARARRSLTRSQQRCLKSAQQEVTLKDQTGNLFVVSHMGEERQVLSSLPVSGNAAGVQSTCLAFPARWGRVCHRAALPNGFCCCCCYRFVSIADLCLQGFGSVPALGMQAGPDFRLQDSLSAANIGCPCSVVLCDCCTLLPSPLTVWGCCTLIWGT